MKYNWSLLQQMKFSDGWYLPFLQGDYLAKGMSLPESIKTGDILIIHDTGANAMSMYSKFNSNIPNPVYGFSVMSQKIFCFKEREILTETLAFWGSKHPRLI